MPRPFLDMLREIRDGAGAAFARVRAAGNPGSIRLKIIVAPASNDDILRWRSRSSNWRGHVELLGKIMDIRMPTLAEELPRQQARCRELLEHAIDIGPAATFMAAMLRESLARAEAAAAAGDLAAIAISLNDLEWYIDGE